MTDIVLDSLQPELVGGLFGRQQSLVEESVLRKIHPGARFVLLGILVVGAILVLAVIDKGLTAARGVPTTLALLIEQTKKPIMIALPLLQDPVGLIAIGMALTTPVLCCEQMKAIRGFNAKNECNITYRLKNLNSDAINAYTSQANEKFRIVGSSQASLILLLLSGILSFAIDYLINRWGLFASWNHTLLTRSAWRREVYAGWWANPHTHLPLAIALWCVGIYFFYFLVKQLVMGGIFALYVRRVMSLEFGVAPNMAVNSDGYWGLRWLRVFMQITYASTLGHFLMVLGILVVWLPFGVFTILVVTAVMIINGMVVIYPSEVARTCAVREKIRYVAYVGRSRRSRSERDAVIDRVWATPNLPFKIRSSLTAATLYVLIPLLLALVSSLLGRIK